MKWFSRLFRKRVLVGLLAFAGLFILLIGPWPISDPHYLEADYARDSFAALDKMALSMESGTLRAGTASADITPAPGVPMGGYSARQPKANEGAMAPVYGKSISISNGQRTLTFVGAEILLPLPELTQAVAAKSNVPLEDLFFTVTHTHSGPGGYANGMVEQFSLGAFHAEYFEQLTDALADTVRNSRESMQPVSLQYHRIEATPREAAQLVYNQMTRGPNGHATLHWLQLLKADRTHLASLVTFSGHSTFLGRVNHQISGDYPGLLQRGLQDQLGGVVMFAVGAVGATLPVALGGVPKDTIEKQSAQMHDLAGRLQQRIQAAHQSGVALRWQSDTAVLDAQRIDVRLPRPTFRWSDHLRISPILVNNLFHDRQSWINAARIGPIFFLSYPADFSGELAQQLEAWGDEQQIYPWVTSFNGDYIGYVSPSSRYDLQHHIVRDLNFFGQWSGDYLLDMGKRYVLKSLRPAQTTTTNK